VVVVIVIMVIPVMIGVPAAAVFVPPFVIAGPATLASFAQFVASPFRLLAFPAMMFRGFVQFVVGPRNATLAFIFVGAYGSRAGKRQGAHQDKGRKSGRNKPQFLQTISHHCFLLGI
jgi:hypothetical protein